MEGVWLVAWFRPGPLLRDTSDGTFWKLCLEASRYEQWLQLVCEGSGSPRGRLEGPARFAGEDAEAQGGKELCSLSLSY